MLLRQRVPYKKQQLDNQVKSVNLDVELLNGILKKSALTKVMPEPSNKMSLQSLSQILKYKNQKSNTYRHEVQQTRQWLKDKGVDFKKINDQIKQNNRLVIQFPIQKIQQKLPASQIPATAAQGQQWGFTRETQLQFIQKQKEFVISKLISEQLNHNKNRNDVRRTLLNKINAKITPAGSGSFVSKGKTQNNKSFMSRQQFIINNDSQENYLRKKNQYFDFVQYLATQGFQASLEKLKFIKPFWKIVLQHIISIEDFHSKLAKLQNDQEENDKANYLNQLKLNGRLMMKSLKLIEKQYQKTLPDAHNFQKQVDYWARQLQKKSRNFRTWRNNAGQPSWAMTFYLLRAGRTPQIRRILQGINKQVYEDFALHQQSLDRQQPKASVRSYDLLRYNDNFFNQISYILQGKPVFDTDIILQRPLNKTWVLIRTLGIYRGSQSAQIKYKEIIEKLFKMQAESLQMLSKQKIFDFLYLGGYKQFMHLLEILQDRKKLPNQSEFNYDDYFHLLTVLNYYPQLWGGHGKNDKLYFQKQYAQKLQIYIHRLQAEGFNNQIPKYLLLAPPKYIQRIVCSLIKTRKQFQAFDWKSLRVLMHQRDLNSGQQLFKYLYKQVIQKIQLKSYDDYEFASQKYRSYFHDQESAIFKEHKCYVSILLKYLHLNHKKRYCIKVSQSSKQFQDDLYNFFQIGQKDRQNQALLLQKDLKVVKRVKQLQERLQNEMLKQYQNNTYYKTNVIVPFKFYKQFNMLTQILQGCLKNQQDYESLKSFKSQWRYSTSMMKNNLQHSPGDQLLALITFLSVQMNPSIISIYVYYLVELIQRRKIICTRQSEYNGILQQMKIILKQLEALYSNLQHIAQANRKSKQPIKPSDELRVNLLQHNPLKHCPQYERSKSELIKYLKEYGGETYSNYKY